MYAASRHLGFDVDYRKMLRYFQERTYLVRAFYYALLVETESYSPVRPLVDWLDYNGFVVVTKPAKEIMDATGRRRVKGSMDVDLAVDMMQLAPRLDHAVLFSGDGNFRRLVEAVQHLGVRVTVVSTMRPQAVLVADELRRQADRFIDLADIAPEFTRSAGVKTAP